MPYESVEKNCPLSHKFLNENKQKIENNECNDKICEYQFFKKECLVGRLIELFLCYQILKFLHGSCDKETWFVVKPSLHKSCSQFSSDFCCGNN